MYNNNVFNSLGEVMKTVVLLVLTAMLTACGTVGGFVSGAGDDLQKAGTWIKSR